MPKSVNDGSSVGRGVPDVAGNASARSGYSGVFVANQEFNGNGTSASAPLWAGLITLINATLGTQAGFVNPILYELGPDYFNPLNQLWPDPSDPALAACPADNSNGGVTGYPAGPGWDACTGWGSPDATKLLNGLAQHLLYQDMQFWVQDSSFGADEVKDTASYSDAFWLVLEGFTPNVLGISDTNPGGSVTPTLFGPFLTLLGSENIAQSGPPILEVPGAYYTPQRIRYPYAITFPGSVVFPGSGESAYLLDAAIAVPGNPTPFTAATVFELVAGADPYVANVDPSQNNVFWLSQDLRVFTATPGLNSTPVSGTGAPSFSSDSVDAAYTYIQDLIEYLNEQIGYKNASFVPPTGTDPLDTMLPSQAGALTGDSSVTPTSESEGSTFSNYNFAIARVRLRGSAGPAGAASDVKVFFRLFSTQTNDTDYVNTPSAVSLNDPFITYPSSPANSPDAPQSPLPGTDSGGTVNGASLPFFATADFSDNPSDYGSGAVNNQTITIPGTGDYAWAFFGCFLNVYDHGNVVDGKSVQQWLGAGAHHCIVAQIAFSGAPIRNADGVTESPENSDKLAQRNLQVTPSGNPVFPATHLIPQSFDLRPSPSSVLDPGGYLLDYPDELMIDWGEVPAGSAATIYWPQASAPAVIDLAERFYTTHQLTADGAHDIRIEASGGVGYVPIPTGTGPSLAGLITLELAQGVRVGQRFEVIIRRISSRQVAAKHATAGPPVTIDTAHPSRERPRSLDCRQPAAAFQLALRSRKLPDDHPRTEGSGGARGRREPPVCAEVAARHSQPRRSLAAGARQIHHHHRGAG